MYYAAVSFCWYANGLGPSRLVHNAEIAMKWCVLHEGAPNFPYHRLDCHIVILVLSTSYQWMAGAMPYVDDIRGWLGAANAGAWCHMTTILLSNHTMIIWRCNFVDRDPLLMVHTTDTNGLLLTNEDHRPLPIHVGNKVYMIWLKIGGIYSTLRPK